MLLKHLRKTLLFSDLFSIRKKSYFYIIFPLIFLSVTFQSTFYFSTTIEQSLRPPFSNDHYQPYNYSPPGIGFDGKVPYSVWKAENNFANFYFSLINSSLYKAGFNSSLVKYNNLTLSVDSPTTNDGSSFTILGSDTLFQDALRELNLELQNFTYENSTIVIKEDNFNISKISNSFNFSSINYSLSVLGFLNRSNFFAGGISSSSYFIIVNLATFNKLFSTHFSDYFNLSSTALFNSQESYRIYYYAEDSNKLQDLEQIATKAILNAGILLTIAPIASTSPYDSFYQQVLVATIIWYAISLFLIIPSVFLLLNAIKRSIHDFKKKFALIMLRGEPLSNFYLYFLIEVLIMFLIQFPLTKFIFWFIFNSYQPFGHKITQSINVFNNWLLLIDGWVLLATILFYIISIRKLVNQNDISPFAGIGTFEVVEKVTTPKILSKNIVLSIVGICFTSYCFVLVTDTFLKIILFVLGAFFVFIFVPELAIFSYNFISYFINKYLKLKNSEIFGIKHLLLQMRFSRILKKIRLTLFFVIILMAFFSYFSSYETNLALHDNYNTGAPIVLRSNIANDFNSSLVQELTSMNGNSGVSITAELVNSYLGSETSVLPQTFSIFGIDPTTYGSLHNLNNPGFELSNSSQYLINQLNSNSSILVHTNFLKSRNLRIGDNLTLIVGNKNNIHYALTFTIVGSFTYWPGFIPLEYAFNLNQSIIMNLDTLQNITNFSSSPLYYQYNVNPSNSFNYDKLSILTEKLGLSVYTQKQAVTDWVADYAFNPALFAFGFFLIIIILYSVYEYNNDVRGLIDDLAIPRAFGISQEDQKSFMIIEQSIQLIVLVLGGIIGYFFGFIILLILNSFGTFPIIFDFDTILFCVIIIGSGFISILGYQLAWHQANKMSISNISSLLSTED